ncbi:MAG: hypothetical protein ACRCSQ_08130, partial [Bacteroidales bacterium]
MRKFLRWPRFPFHKSLFFFGTGIFFLFMSAAFLYQYNREKNFRKELLNDVLQGYNYTILQNIEKDSTTLSNLNLLIDRITEYDLRVTLMDLHGNVLFDNKKHENQDLN